MSDENKRNLLYFESETMRGLYDILEAWQLDNNKRLLSTSIQIDRGHFCCIALSNPTEVIICSGTDKDKQAVVDLGCLFVR